MTNTGFQTSPPLNLAPVFLFGESAAMQLRIAPTKNHHGYTVMIEAAPKDKDRSKISGKPHFQFRDQKTSAPLPLEGVYGFLMVAKGLKEEYETFYGDGAITLRAQGPDYRDKYPLELSIRSTNKLSVYLTPGNTIAIMGLLAKTASASQGLSIAETMRMIDIGLG